MDFHITSDDSWTRQAACADDGVGPMYPSEKNTAGIEYAKGICHACPVRLTCLDTAIDNDEPYGIWGGMTTPERRAMKRKRKQVASRTRALVKPSGSPFSRPAIG